MATFSCGLTQYELRQLNKIKVFGTVILENVPQLLSQAMYAYAISEVSEAIMLAFSASLLSVAASTLSYWITKDVSDTIPVEYYLLTQCYKRMGEDTNNDNHEGANTKRKNRLNIAINHKQQSTNLSGSFYTRSHSISSSDEAHHTPEILPPPSRISTSKVMSNTLTEIEKANLLANRGKRWYLGKGIAEVFGIPQENIEVGFSMMNQHGLVSHIVHFVYLSDLSLMEEQIQTVVNDNVFRKHFHVGGDFSTKFSRNLKLTNSKKQQTLLNLLAQIHYTTDENEPSQHPTPEDKINEDNWSHKIQHSMSMNKPHHKIQHSNLRVLQKVTLNAMNSISALNATESVSIQKFPSFRGMESNKQTKLISRHSSNDKIELVSMQNNVPTNKYLNLAYTFKVSKPVEHRNQTVKDISLCDSKSNILKTYHGTFSSPINVNHKSDDINNKGPEISTNSDATMIKKHDHKAIQYGLQHLDQILEEVQEEEEQEEES
eukprot:467807_1